MIHSDLLEIETLTVKRMTNEGKIVYETGEPQQPDFTEFTINANVQNDRAFRREQEEENDRDSETLVLFTETQLEHKDVVLRNGVEYEVRDVSDWTQLEDLAHYEIRVVRIDV